MVYRKLPDRISDPGPLLGAMRSCRKAMIDASTRVKPMGTIFHGLNMVVSAIDALATLLIGRQDYFWAQGSAPIDDAARAREAADREAESRLRPSDE
jgi:hypothetical protein